MGLKTEVSGMRVRLRLTLLYGVLSLFSGAVLLAITYLLVARNGPTIVASSISRFPAGGSARVADASGLVQVVRAQAEQQREETIAAALPREVRLRDGRIEVGATGSSYGRAEAGK
jgi:hypothetical protein